MAAPGSMIAEVAVLPMVVRVAERVTSSRPDWALAEVVLLWLSVASLVAVCGRYSRAAALLLLPYLAWVGIAGLLNWEVVRLNGPFG